MSAKDEIAEALHSGSRNRIRDALQGWLAGTFTDDELEERKRVESANSGDLQNSLSVGQVER